jgi:hypothetical protein
MDRSIDIIELNIQAMKLQDELDRKKEWFRALLQLIDQIAQIQGIVEDAGTKNIAKILFKKGFSPVLIQKITGLSPEEIQALK